MGKSPSGPVKEGYEAAPVPGAAEECDLLLPHESHDEEGERGWDGHIFKCFGQCDSHGCGSCGLAYFLPCVAFGLNMRRGLVLSALKQALIFAVLVGLTWSLRAAQTAAAVAECPPPFPPPFPPHGGPQHGGLPRPLGPGFFRRPDGESIEGRAFDPDTAVSASFDPATATSASFDLLSASASSRDGPFPMDGPFEGPLDGPDSLLGAAGGPRHKPCDKHGREEPHHDDHSHVHHADHHDHHHNKKHNHGTEHQKHAERDAALLDTAAITDAAGVTDTAVMPAVAAATVELHSKAHKHTQDIKHRSGKRKLAESDAAIAETVPETMPAVAAATAELKHDKEHNHSKEHKHSKEHRAEHHADEQKHAGADAAIHEIATMPAVAAVTVVPAVASLPADPAATELPLPAVSAVTALATVGALAYTTDAAAVEPVTMEDVDTAVAQWEGGDATAAVEPMMIMDDIAEPLPVQWEGGNDDDDDDDHHSHHHHHHGDGFHYHHQHHGFRDGPPDMEMCEGLHATIDHLWLALVLYSIGLSVYAARRRTELRERFNIAGSKLGDFVAWFFCPSCALCQETRTLAANNVEAGVWRGRAPTGGAVQYAALEAVAPPVHVMAMPEDLQKPAKAPEDLENPAKP